MILSYTATCSDSDDVVVSTLTTVDLSAVLDGLSPYSFYSCSILATTNGGSGPAATLNFTTASDSKFARCHVNQMIHGNINYDFAVPEDSPVNVLVVGITASSVLITWIEPTTPHGVVTSYNLYVNYSDGSPITAIQSGASATNYTLTNLQPYQLVTVQVSASTAVGEGPRSQPAIGRAREEGLFSKLECFNQNQIDNDALFMQIFHHLMLPSFRMACLLLGKRLLYSAGLLYPMVLRQSPR